MILNKDGKPRKKNKLRVDRGLPRTKTSHLSVMRLMKSGETFFTDKLDKEVTAQAHHQKIKVLTNRCYLIENIHASEPKIRQVTKVTII